MPIILAVEDGKRLRNVEVEPIERWKGPFAKVLLVCQQRESKSKRSKKSAKHGEETIFDIHTRTRELPVLEPILSWL